MLNQGFCLFALLYELCMFFSSFNTSLLDVGVLITFAIIEKVTKNAEKAETSRKVNVCICSQLQGSFLGIAAIFCTFTAIRLFVRGEFGGVNNGCSNRFSRMSLFLFFFCTLPRGWAISVAVPCLHRVSHESTTIFGTKNTFATF